MKEIQIKPINYENRPYRACVGIMLINAKGQIFSGQRIDNRAEAWQMPQGGIDEGEDIETCLLYTSPSPRDISGSRMPSSA